MPHRMSKAPPWRSYSTTCLWVFAIRSTHTHWPVHVGLLRLKLRLPRHLPPTTVVPSLRITAFFRETNYASGRQETTSLLSRPCLHRMPHVKVKDTQSHRAAQTQTCHRTRRYTRRRGMRTHMSTENTLLHRATRNENTHVLPSYTGRRGMRTYMSSKHHTSLCRESWAAASVSFIFWTLQKETSTSLTVESCFLFMWKCNSVKPSSWYVMYTSRFFCVILSSPQDAGLPADGIVLWGRMRP